MWLLVCVGWWVEGITRFYLVVISASVCSDRSTDHVTGSGALSALSVSGVCGLNDERVVVVVEEVDDEAELGDDEMMMMVMTMKTSGLSKNLIGDRNEVVEFESAAARGHRK